MTIDQDLDRAVTALHGIDVATPPYPRLRRRHHTRLAAAAVAVVALVGVAGVALAAGGGDPGDRPEDRGAVAAGPDGTDRPSPTDSGPEPPATIDRFCTTEATMPDDVPEAYVGSSAHVADVAALLDVAPTEIRRALETYRSFLAGGGVDPDDPDSNLYENWPPEVQDAIDAITDYVAAHC